MTTTPRTPTDRPTPAATDDELKALVVAELQWVPDVDASHVGVTAAEGAVTLWGHVSSYPERRLAVKAAQRVRGVGGVADEMTVRTTVDGLDDADLALAAGEALEGSVEVPPTVRVAVHQHVVTLTGAVTGEHQRLAAGRAVQHLPGVLDLYNLITLSPGVATAWIKTGIGEALVRNARVDARTITVSADDGGIVTLTGTVRSWGERRQAEQTCWAAPGVLGVLDHLHVEH